MQHVDTPQRHVHNRVILKVTKRFMNQWGVLAHFWQFIMFKERSRGPKLPILKRCKGIGGGDLDQKKAMYKWTPYQTFESIVIGAFKSLSWKLFSFNRLLAKVKHLTFTSLKFKILTLLIHFENLPNAGQIFLPNHEFLSEFMDTSNGLRLSHASFVNLKRQSIPNCTLFG